MPPETIKRANRAQAATAPKFDSPLARAQAAQVRQADRRGDGRRGQGDAKRRLQRRAPGPADRHGQDVDDEEQQAGKERQVAGPIEPAAEIAPERSERAPGPGVEPAVALEPGGQLGGGQAQRRHEAEQGQHPQDDRAGSGAAATAIQRIASVMARV